MATARTPSEKKSKSTKSKPTALPTIRITPGDGYSDTPPFEKVDLTPHLGGGLIEGDAISASDDALWALGSRDLFRVESDGTVERVLRAPGTHVFTHLAANGRTVAATYTGGLFVSREGKPFRRLAFPLRGKNIACTSLLVRPDGGLCLELGATWWQCGPTGEWTTEPKSFLEEQYGIKPQRGRFSSPCVDADGTIYALVDTTTSADKEDDLPQGARYVRRQKLCVLSAEEGWKDHTDLHAAGLAVIPSGVDQNLWIGGVCLVRVRDDAGHPAWLVGRPDGLHPFVKGRIRPVTFLGDIFSLYSDGDRTVVVRELRGGAEPLLWLSRDAGARFERIALPAPGKVNSVLVHRGEAFLGLVHSDRPGFSANSAWIVRVR